MMPVGGAAPAGAAVGAVPAGAAGAAFGLGGAPPAGNYKAYYADINNDPYTNNYTNEARLRMRTR